MQRLRSTENGGQGLNRNPNDIVVRLLCRQRAAGSLRMKSQDRGLRISAMESLRHHFVPDLSRGAIFRNLLEQIVMGIEEERKPRREIVNIEAAAKRPFDIFDSIVEREREFLQRRRSRFTDVISADGNRVPL